MILGLIVRPLRLTCKIGFILLLVIGALLLLTGFWEHQVLGGILCFLAACVGAFALGGIFLLLSRVPQRDEKWEQKLASLGVAFSLKLRAPIVRLRVYAFCIDKLLMFYGTIFIMSKFNLLNGKSMAMALSNVKNPQSVAIMMYVFMFIDVFIFLDSLYSAVFDSSSLQGTIGKKLFGLRVADIEGRRISFFRALIRNGYEALLVFHRLLHITFFVAFEVILCVIIAKMVHPEIALIFAAIVLYGLFIGDGRWQRIRSKLMNFPFSRDMIFGSRVMASSPAGGQ